MRIDDAQREMRTAFLGGFMGQLVSGTLWAVSAALATWGTPRQAIIFLVVAGMGIFPLTQIGLRTIGRAGAVGPSNTLYSLGPQVAFPLPLALPVVGAAALYRLDWFYPAFMIVLGAHYLPFVFMYGMRMYYALAAILWVAGMVLGLWIEAPFATGAWLTAGILFVFAVLGRALTLREERVAG
ncbi:MAG: hypothetical protein R3195_11925 [Gemmatimonadota bacterium]|nr:hypothetical protein [Gemmatimonadota bacterium]